MHVHRYVLQEGTTFTIEPVLTEGSWNKTLEAKLGVAWARACWKANQSGLRGKTDGPLPQRTAAAQPSPSLRGVVRVALHASAVMRFEHTILITAEGCEVRSNSHSYVRQLKSCIHASSRSRIAHCVFGFRCRFLRDVERCRGLCQNTSFANAKYCCEKGNTRIRSLLMRPEIGITEAMICFDQVPEQAS